jgi:hypothetical protein
MTDVLEELDLLDSLASAAFINPESCMGWLPVEYRPVIIQPGNYKAMFPHVMDKPWACNGVEIYNSIHNNIKVWVRYGSIVALWNHGKQYFKQGNHYEYLFTSYMDNNMFITFDKDNLLLVKYKDSIYTKFGAFSIIKGQLKKMDCSTNYRYSYVIFARPSSNELPTTEIELSAMAMAATSGLRVKSQALKIPAAIGMPSAL